MKMDTGRVWATGLACLVIAASVAGRTGAIDQTRTAKGTLTIGTTSIALTHALAVAATDASGAATYHVLVTNKPVPTAAALDWDAVALHMAEHELHGLEIVVGADRRLVRTNVYAPQAAMGARLLQAPLFEPATLDGKTIAARLSTANPIQDARLRTTIAFDVTFTAPVRQPGF